MMLCRQDVLTNHTTETIATLDTSLVPRRCRREHWARRVGLSSANITSGLPVRGPARIRSGEGAVGRRYWLHATTSSFIVLHGPPFTA
jgi:hypothetical protein